MITYNKIMAIDSMDNIIEIATKIKTFGDTKKIVITPQKDCFIKEVILHSDIHNFDKNAYIYADGYSKLSQYGGTLEKFGCLNYFSDKDHYKMPQKNNFVTSYNYMTIKQGDAYILVGASSCNFYRTEFRINNAILEIAQCLENKHFLANEPIQLESMFYCEGQDINIMLDNFSSCINENHPPKKFHESPVGWCSWYCIGPNISEEKIFQNLTIIKDKLPELKYIQIDDGFQPFMGDWLKVSDKFHSSMKEICHDIRQSGFEPAIWLAPFIASQKSELLNSHPEFFVKDNNDNPLCTKDVTFEGWRDSPWYCMDGSNPATLKYILDVVHTIYKDWGVKYFKLDANMWGAMPFGKRFDSQCTSVEAYRKGMQAIWDATGDDAFILGCNAPMWPSLGLVSGMRITGDIVRNTKQMSGISNECFKRNWMNELWQNDPDCMLMANTNTLVVDAGGRQHKSGLKSRFYKFNNVYIRASGGFVLSGDYISKYSKDDIDRFKRIVSLPHIPAKFDDNLECGLIAYDNTKEYCIFNKTKLTKKTFTIALKENAKVTDMYNNKSIKTHNNVLTIKLKKFDCAWIKIEE